MRSIGKWLEAYGESIYGTRSTAVPAQEWGVLFHTDENVSFESSEEGVTLRFDKLPQVDLDYIVELTFVKKI